MMHALKETLSRPHRSMTSATCWLWAGSRMCSCLVHAGIRVSVATGGQARRAERAVRAAMAFVWRSRCRMSHATIRARLSRPEARAAPTAIPSMAIACQKRRSNGHRASQARMIVPESINAPKGETSKRIICRAESLCMKWIVLSGGDI